jgi:putative FmdB family regulatory protein
MITHHSVIKAWRGVIMPIYNYACLTCGLHFERRQHFNDPPLQQCPKCGGKVRRVFSPPAIVFKGSGFYVTDNRSNGNGRNNGGGRSSPKEKGMVKEEAV